MFWLTSLFLAFVVGGFIIRPIWYGQEATRDDADVTLYKAQLAEIDSDLARGVIEPEDAERTRTEIARRLLAVSKTSDTLERGTSGRSKTVALCMVFATALLSAGIYFGIGAPGEPDQPLANRLALAEKMRESRPSQAAFEAAAAPVPAPDAPEEYLESVQQLREIMQSRPDDRRGWELLVRHETALRNFSAAARAQEQVLRLTDTPDISASVQLLDLLVVAADGYVSPEAEKLARDILNRDEENIAARYYIGALHNLTDRPDIAFRLWRPIVEDGEDTYHTALARSQIEGAAWRAGVEYTLPVERGPSAAEMAAAEDMSPEDRTAMIGGMVAGLADRLATEGGPASDWARLIRAYGVLGDTENAASIWQEAQRAFASDPTAIDILRIAAQDAGVLE